MLSTPFPLVLHGSVGWVPISAAAPDKAIELNGAAVEANRQAFLWGRRVLRWTTKRVKSLGLWPSKLYTTNTGQTDCSRSAHLTAAYQDKALAETYQRRIKAIRQAGDDALTRRCHAHALFTGAQR